MCWCSLSFTCPVHHLLPLLPSISSRPPAHRPPLKSPALRLCPLHLPPPRQSAILIFSSSTAALLPTATLSSVPPVFQHPSLSPALAPHHACVVSVQLRLHSCDVLEQPSPAGPRNHVRVWEGGHTCCGRG
jgi:hypothetical protein